MKPKWTNGRHVWLILTRNGRLTGACGGTAMMAWERFYQIKGPKYPFSESYESPRFGEVYAKRFGYRSVRIKYEIPQ